MGMPAESSPKRIYDDCNHPLYGKVRRCWIVLKQLGLVSEDVDRLYMLHHDMLWDEHLEVLLTKYRWDEQRACRVVVSRILHLPLERD